MITRRNFIQTTSVAAAALAGGRGLAATPRLKLLILGGTGFIGPHMVRAAQARGHEVTLFNRGRTNPNPDVETLIGDRDGDIAALQNREWDAVIDNSGYVPRHVGDSARLLSDQVKRYLFISSISVYKDFAADSIDESYPLGKLPADHTGEQVTGATYGPFKVLCEAAVQSSLRERATIVRPGYIVGPGDRTDRWTYWPVRVAAGGPMLVPGSPEDPMQFIGVTDLAEFVVKLLETDTPGTFNAVGPGSPMTMGALINALGEAIGTTPEPVWTGNEFLSELKANVPIWAPPVGDFRGVHLVEATRALSNGLTHTPAGEIGRQTVDWWRSLDEERREAMRDGLRMDPDLPPGPAPMSKQLAVERELLSRWHDKANA